jgi:hypothetical protein
MTLVNRTLAMLILFALMLEVASAHMGIDGREFQARRRNAMAVAPDGILERLREDFVREGRDEKRADSTL